MQRKTCGKISEVELVKLQGDINTVYPKLQGKSLTSVSHFIDEVDKN